MRWFRHETSAHRDEALAAIVARFGWAGYGRWWRVVELLAADFHPPGIPQLNIRMSDLCNALEYEKASRCWTFLQGLEGVGLIKIVAVERGLTGGNQHTAGRTPAGHRQDTGRTPAGHSRGTNLTLSVVNFAKLQDNYTRKCVDSTDTGSPRSKESRKNNNKPSHQTKLRSLMPPSSSGNQEF